jgi:hypothetical protein
VVPPHFAAVLEGQRTTLDVPGNGGQPAGLGGIAASRPCTRECLHRSLVVRHPSPAAALWSGAITRLLLSVNALAAKDTKGIRFLQGTWVNLDFPLSAGLGASRLPGSRKGDDLRLPLMSCTNNQEEQWPTVIPNPVRDPCRREFSSRAATVVVVETVGVLFGQHGGGGVAEGGRVVGGVENQVAGVG